MAVDNGSVLVKKIIILAILSVILLIPLQFIKIIVDERDSIYRQTAKNISAEWGIEQVIASPYVSLPYYYKVLVDKTFTDNNGNTVTKKVSDMQRQFIQFFPKVLNADVTLNDDIRKRGIYKTVVYDGRIIMTGEIPINYSAYAHNNVQLLDSKLMIPITQTSAVSSIEEVMIGGKVLEDFSTVNSDGMGYIVARLPDNFLVGKKSLDFKVAFKFRGSNNFRFAPMAISNKVNIKSTWADPSFSIILPDNKTITKEGFSADWTVTNIQFENDVQRSTETLPAYFLSETQKKKYDDYDVYETYEEALNSDVKTIKVTLAENITHYRSVERAVKYGILFVILSIVALLVFDILGDGKKTHILQYMIVSASLVMFYLLLLSLSEYLSFSFAYVISMVAVILPISLYVFAIAKSKKGALSIGIALVGLYLVLFSILKMEDFALITGSVLVMITIYVLMYITRNLVNKGNPPAVEK